MKLCEESHCSGCGACINACPNSCISMVKNSQGFDYPSINDDLCVKCGLCEKVCAKVQEKYEEKNPKIYSATFLGDDQILKNSSSGGAAYALAKKCIEDGGVVFGSAYDDKLRVHHITVSSINDLKKLQGSKYVQSSIGSSYKEAKDILRSGKKVMFFGTPCQIHGLKAFLSDDEMKNLITCDLLCGGVPSPGVFEKYVFELNSKYGKIDSYNFRSKRYGYGYLISNVNEKVLTGHDASFIKTLGAGYVRESCFDCQFRKISRVGDITIGDFWNLKVPFKQWTKGVSSILVNTVKGSEMLKMVSDTVLMEERSLNDLMRSQTTSIAPIKKRPKDYDEFFLDYPKMTWHELSKKYLMPKSFKAKFVEAIPPFIMAFVRNFKRKMHS